MFMKSYNWLKTALFILVLGIFVALSATATQAAVSLVYFLADDEEEGVLLEWETATETETAGFRIRRSDNPNENLTVNLDGADVDFIPSEADDAGFGTQYTVYDESAIAGQTYVYSLYEVTNSSQLEFLSESGSITFTGSSGVSQLPTPTPITPAPSEATNTPVPTATPTTTTNTTATAVGTNPTTTATATATPSLSPTNTPANTDSSTQQPTSTATSTATSPPPTSTPATVAQVASPTPQVDNSGVAEASAQEQDPYPNPDETQGEEPFGEAVPIESVPDATGYPAGEAPTGSTGTNGEPTPYVEPVDNNGSTSANENGQSQAIGAGSEPTIASTPTPASAENEGDRNSNTLILWVGFIVALIIFGGGVIGSLIVFARRENNG